MRYGLEFQIIMLQTFGRAVLAHRRPALVIQNTQCSVGEERLGAALVGGGIFSLDFAGKESGRGGHLISLRSPGDNASGARRDGHQQVAGERRYPTPLLLLGGKLAMDARCHSGNEENSGRHVHRAPAAVWEEHKWLRSPPQRAVAGSALGRADTAAGWKPASRMVGDGHAE